MKLLAELQRQVGLLGTLRRAWFTSFNADVEFVETYVLPATLGASVPRSRLEYEQLQQELTKEGIDFRVFCDLRFLETNRIKRTCIPVHGIRPARKPEWFSEASLFHPKVIYLEDRSGKRVVGAGSANLTLSGWGLNLEAFQFFEVTTRANYREIRQFFEHVCHAADIPCNLDDRRSFKGEPENWRFVHSYQEETFPRQLLGGASNVDLAVWSPYLPCDLAGFIGELGAAAGAHDVRVHLVPDRLQGKYLRTAWSERLSRMKADGGLAFYDHPIARHERTELCHAKLWKLPGRLAVGSWNFTGPGSNSLRDGKGDWSRDNNVEAGFLIDDRHGWRSACGMLLDLGEEDCAPPEMLEAEGLVVDPLPPFDLHVAFDWHVQAYAFSGKWLGNGSRDGYLVCLPGVPDALPLVWNGHLLPVQPESSRIEDSALLRDRVFKVLQGDKEVLRGLVTELNVMSRRAQSFGTLQDLLEALMQDEDPQSLHELPLRPPVGTTSVDADTFPDEAVAAATDASKVPAGVDAPVHAGISYFRLFHSMRTYRLKLSRLEKIEALDRQVFTWPGCLLELVDKTRAELQQSGLEVFNWFLANEVGSLCELARARRRSLVRGAGEREPSYTPIPEARWRELAVGAAAAPAGASPQYLALVKGQWDHG